MLALATLLSLLIKKPPEEEAIIGASLYTSEKGERVAARRKQRQELAHDKEASSRKWEMIQTVQEVTLFLIFGFLLMVVSYGDLENSRFQFTKSTGDLFGGFQEVGSVLYCMLQYSFYRNRGARIMCNCILALPCLPPMWPGFKSRGLRQMWVQFVVDSR